MVVLALGEAMRRREFISFSVAQRSGRFPHARSKASVSGVSACS